jgi:hypothetical protein
MPRADLLALTHDDLAALTNRGTVKRAERELQEVTCDIHEEADGTISFSWSDGVRCTFAGKKVVAQGTCTCPATEMCRHLVRSVLAYQKHTAAHADAAAPPQSWNPGDVTDEDLARLFKPAVLTRARERFARGVLVELVRGSKPSAYFHDPPCLLRLTVPADVRYAQCDCAEPAPCSHVPLAVWAFRRLDPNAESGMIATETAPPPIPGELLDEAEETLAEWAEVGLAGAGGAWKDLLARLEKRCRIEGLIWPAEILHELGQQLERYVQRDALFEPLRVVELVGEFLIRADAIRRPTGAVPQLFVRGSASDQALEIASARYIGLGCGVTFRKRLVELAAYLQDADSGSVVAVTRAFPDPDGEEPRSLTRLGETPVVKGAHMRQLGAGQLLVQGGKRSADHRLIVGRARANVNPQNYAWEKLRSPLFAETFGEVQARLALLPPAALRPRRVADHIHVCGITRAEDTHFDVIRQCVEARLIDAAGQSAVLEHPFTSRSAEGTELLLERLTASPERVRFVAGMVEARQHGLLIRPTCVIFQDGETRSAVQPWVDRYSRPVSTAAPAVTTVPAEVRPVDELGDYLREVHQFLAEVFLTGLTRSDTRMARALRQTADRGDALGFAHIHHPLKRLADALELRAKQCDWNARRAASDLLLASAWLTAALGMARVD